jgi:putative two-component system hydrogenase maturation factor HypX/HoxX
MRSARKSSLYRHEVTEAATLRRAARGRAFCAGAFVPTPLARSAAAGVRGLRPLLRQPIGPSTGSATTVPLSSLGSTPPTVFRASPIELFGEPCRLFDAWPEDRLRGGAPGEVIAWRETAILRATVDGALWIGHVRREAAGR